MVVLTRFFRSVRHAWHGVLSVYRTEQNFRIQWVCALAANVCAQMFPLATEQRLIILVVSVSVLVLELLNSAVERLLDLLKPRLNDYAGEVKDVMAGAVLLTSFLALAVGASIFWPYMTSFLARV